MVLFWDKFSSSGMTMSYDVMYCKLQGLCSGCSWYFYHDSFSYLSPLPVRLPTKHYTLFPFDVVFSFTNMTGYSLSQFLTDLCCLVRPGFGFLSVSTIYIYITTFTIDCLHNTCDSFWWCWCFNFHQGFP